MEPEDNDRNEQKQDEQDLGAVNKLLHSGAKKVKSKFSMMFKKILTTVIIPIIIKLVPLLLCIALITCVITWWNKKFGDSNVSSRAVSEVLKRNKEADGTSSDLLDTGISISNSGNGYYFKIPKDSLDRYVDELNKAYTQGYFSAEVDEDDIISDEDIDKIEEEFTSKNLEEWFCTNNEKIYTSYFMKMIRAQIASTYPKLGNYGSPDEEADDQDTQGNPKDKDGDYVAQGVVKIKRTLINNDGTKGREIDLTYLPYSQFKQKINNKDESVLYNFSFDESEGVIYYATYKSEIITKIDENGTKTETSSKEIYEAPPMSYKSLVSMCSMPYDYLFSLLQVSHNPEWVMAVCDLLLQESDVVIMIQDQLNITTDTEVRNNAVKVVTKYYEYVVPEADDEESSEEDSEQGQTGTGESSGGTGNIDPGTGAGGRRPGAGDITMQQLSENSDNKEEETGHWEEKTTRQTTSYSLPASNGETTITTQYTNTAIAFIKKAKTWCMDYEQNVGDAPIPVIIDGEEQISTYTNDELATYSYTVSSDFKNSFPDPKTQTQWADSQTSYSTEKLLYSYKTDTKNYTWTPAISTNKTLNYSKFLGTLKNDTGKYYQGADYKEDGIEVKYPKPGLSICNIVAADAISDGDGQGIDLLLNLLSRHEDTHVHEEIMKYFWNIYIGKDYYNTDLTGILSLFKDSTLSSISGKAIENYIKAWENDALWRYEKDLTTSIPSKYLTEDQQYYIVYEDGSKGHNNISYGIATFIEKASGSVNHSLYGNGYYNWVDEFAAYGVDVTTLKTGDLVPVDACQAVFKEILERFENNVDTYLSTYGLVLSQAQRDALVAVCYQYGNIIGFKEAYDASLDSEGNIDPEAIKDNFILTARSDKAKPFSDEGRKYANWYLFTEETYIDRSGNIINSAGGTILECAKKIHDYMSDPAHLYYYCLGGTEVSRQVHKDAGLNNCGLNASFEESQIPGRNGYRLTCCATYVSWVLEEAGYLETHTNSSQTLRGYLDELGWQPVTAYNQLESGDIVFMDTDGVAGHNYSDITHVQIYAGEGTWYNAGNNSSIHKVEPYPSVAINGFVIAYRAPY